MRILIVTPQQPLATGNQVTAERYQEALRQRGHAVQLTVTAEDDPALLRRVLSGFRPEVVHLLHAYRAGRPWLACGTDQETPCVVTLTGTDINQDIDTTEEGPIIREVLRRAGAIITQNRLTAAELQGRPVPWAGKVHYVPPATMPGNTPYPLRRRHDIPPEAIVFLLPAGLRPIKGNLELLRLFDQVAAQRPGGILAFCGPVLDRTYAGHFLAALRERPWTRYLGVIPSTAMAAVLAQVEVVLNHSLSEGLPNALVEAAAQGRPILARDIPGNAAVVEAEINGLVYRDEEEFVRHAIALIDSPDLRRRLGRPQAQRYNPAAESAALETIYRRLLAGQ